MNLVKVATEVVGEVDIQDDAIISFPQGLLGFEELRKFTLINIGDDIPFTYLQSVEIGELAFVVANPFVFYPEYEFELSADTKQQLEIEKPEDVVLVSMVTIKNGELKDATINLLAPVIINVRTTIGKQIILHDSTYNTKHQLVR